MATQNSYQQLIGKLDQFIRKYYVNKLIRGLLYSIGLVLFLFLVISVLEYYYYFNPNWRKVLFFSFIGVSLTALGYWVVDPLLRYFRLGRVISHDQAAAIIGNHFTNVKDKLLNILQLRSQAAGSAENSLIMASIDQKSEEIKLVPFSSAINLGSNRRYLRYALPPLLLLLVLLFAAPSVIRDSTTRLINNNREYTRPAPFQFKIANEDLSVVQYNDYPLTVEIEGDQLPSEVFIDVDNYQYRLTKVASNRFTYNFSKVQDDVDFRIFSGRVASRRYELDVLKKPNIMGFEVKLDYPDYTLRKDETLDNVGDLVLPLGTQVTWIFNAENTDNIDLSFSQGAQAEEAKRFSDDLFTYKKQALDNQTYKLTLSNEALPKADSIRYALSIIPDLYPEISAERFVDSTDEKMVFFAGEATDDYGIRNISFNYRIKRLEGGQGALQTQLIRRPEAKRELFEHVFDINELDLQPGDEVSYYFEVYDNDGINGSKSSRTSLMVFATPTLEEYEEMAEQNDENIKDNLQKALDENREVQEEMKRLREKLLQEKEMDWQSRKEMERLMERQKEIQKKLEEARKAFEENLEQQQEYSQPNESMQEKQEQMQKLFDNSMNEEMQKLMQQIQELMQELEKEDALEMMEDMEFQDQEREMEIDRLLELFKQLELEQEIQQANQKLDKLAEKQEKLSEQTEKMDQQQGQDEQKDEEASEEQKDQQDAESEEGEESEEAEQEGEQPSEEGEESEENQEGQQSEENQEGQQKQQEQDQQQQQDGEQGEQESEQEPKNQEDLKKQQEEINKEFEKLQEQMEQIQQKNQQMENQMPMQDRQEQMDDIQRDLQESQQQLQQQQNQKASEFQKDAAKKMREMSQQMNGQMQAGQMQQMQEDIESLRQLLENLVGLSFDQEGLMDEFESTEINTPRYVDLVQEQFKLKDDFRLIEDSLQALSKRVFQIESFVTEKMNSINGNLNQSIEDLEERRKFQAADHQQRSMKNTNDLALMLSETMNQMQQQMQSMMSGSQMCQNPQQQQNKQGGQQLSDKISQGQKKLNEEMRKKAQQSREQRQGQGMSAEEYAKMAARQAALRRALEEKQKELREQGKGANKELQEIIEQMDRQETELVNKRLTNEMMQRQQEILNRLLEHEKAERQQKFKNERKSEVGDNKERQMPAALEEYIKQRKSEVELYKSVSPALRPYYKSLVEEYFKTLKGETEE